ncbi:MAG: ABC transporter permease [Bacteroidetes bacterium]|nr:ABC transporter permease [Bacteroidota bacterium]MBS1974001.1 ABC transporter permease [Bacteroidota bacterium]
MLKNFFLVAFRNFKKNKSFSVINISGLAIGMAAAILILLWVQNEMSFDRGYPKISRLYRMYNRDKFSGDLWAWGTTPKIMAPTLKKDYPEIEDAVRITYANFLFTLGDKKLTSSGNFVDSGFLNMFDLPMISGNPNKALGGIYNIVITQKFAKKFFGNDDPMGKTVKIDSADFFTVTGVLKDLPNNTSFNFDYLLPWSYLRRINQDDEFWGNNSVTTYVLLKPNASHASFDSKVKNMTIEHTKNGEKSTTEVFSYPLSKVYLYGKSENGKLTDGRIATVRLFSTIAGFILLIACINFMNLSTARSEKRGKEVGIRKVVGAGKFSLVSQFIGETILLALFAGIIALIIVQFSLPLYNQLVNKLLYLDYFNVYFWLEFFGFILFTGIVAGSYPAFFLSSFQPIKVLKGTFRAAHAAINPRKILVVAQFTFAIVLIISTIIVLNQINYAQSRETGYQKNNLIYMFLEGDMGKNYDLIKEGLLNNGAATGVTKSMSPITQRFSDGWGFSWQGSTPEDAKLDFVRLSSDADFLKVMGATLVEGRDIDIRNYPGDSTAMLLNETAVKKMRLKSPLGQIINGDGQNWKVTGVIKDFIFESPYDPVNPLMIMGPKSWFNVMHIKLNPGKPVAEDLKLAEQVFKQYNPQYPFGYHFVDKEYAKKFEDTKRTGTLAGLFAGLTIIISCLGLFGLAAYMAENRIKEIGVRKVLGASVANIASLLSKDFLKLVAISFVVASPVAWYAMHKWLADYNYRISIEWWVFALAGLLAMLISLLTVSFQAVKAAMANPVKSLRTE